MELKKMTKRQLESALREYEDLINGEFPCYGTGDIRYLDAIRKEIDKRGLGISVSYKLT